MTDYGRCVTHHICECQAAELATLRQQLSALQIEHEAAQRYRAAGMLNLEACHRWQDAVEAAEKVKE